MLDEHTARRPEFLEGRWVRLADGRSWSLPDRVPTDDGDAVALLDGIGQSEDQNERLFGELALTIFLLARNYQLRPSDLQTLLRFDPSDPALRGLQHDVHALVVASMETVPGRERLRVPEPAVPERMTRPWTLSWFGLGRRGGSTVSAHPSSPAA